MAKKPALSPEEARAEALGTALATIERKYGKGAVMKLSDEAHVNIPVIPTGSIGLDLALGVGGIPRGRITEIFGPESSGKTTLTLHIIAECQKMGGTCAFVDAEHALDVNYARRLGVNTDELLISQPDYGEQALDIADMLVRSGAVDLVVTDQPTALSACKAYPAMKMLEFTGSGDDFDVSEEETNFGISVQKGNAGLTAAINEVLAAYTADDYTAMMDQAIEVQPLNQE